MSSKYSGLTTEVLQHKLRKLEEESINIRAEIQRRTDLELRELQRRVYQLNVRNSVGDTQLQVV